MKCRICNEEAILTPKGWRHKNGELYVLNDDGSDNHCLQLSYDE